MMRLEKHLINVEKIIGLDYPAGPEIDNLAKKGDSNKFDFPIPKVEGFNISYSGTKTAFMNFINNSIQKDSNL